MAPGEKSEPISYQFHTNLLISTWLSSRIGYRPGTMTMLDLEQTNNLPSGPPRPSTILWPGIRSLPEGVERYLVEGGGSVVVAIEPGDEVAVVDIEGGQACELAAADPGGSRG